MVNSLVWTPEEAKYLKALLRWQDTDDEKWARLEREEAAKRRRKQQEQQGKPVGEFRILVIGGRGTGKTAILTRFGQGTFRGEGEPPDPFYTRGCRRPITLNNTSSHQQTYMVDALEMPSQHLLSNPMLAQALSITEAAVLVYDVRDEASLRLAKGLAEFIREHFSPSSSRDNTTTTKNPDTGRVYPLMLIGNKADSPSPSPSLNASSKKLHASKSRSQLTQKHQQEDSLPTNERAVTWTEGSKAAAGMGVPGQSPSPFMLASAEPSSSSSSSSATVVAAATTSTTTVTNVTNVGAAFLEVSAKTGENVDQIFPLLGAEILRMRERREREREIERERERRRRVMAMQDGADGDSGEGMEGRDGKRGERRKFGLWRVLGGRFVRRGEGEGVRG